MFDNFLPLTFHARCRNNETIGITNPSWALLLCYFWTTSTNEDTKSVKGGELLALGRLPSLSQLHRTAFATASYCVTLRSDEKLDQSRMAFPAALPAYYRAGLMTSFANENGRPSRIPRWVVVRDSIFLMNGTICAASCCTSCDK